MIIPEHLDEVFDGGVGFFGNVSERVVSLNDAASDQTGIKGREGRKSDGKRSLKASPNDAGPVEELSRYVGQIPHAEKGQRLNDCKRK